MTQTGCSDKVLPDGETPRPAALSKPVVSTPIPEDPFTPIVQTAESGLSVTWLRYGASLADVRLPDGTRVLASLQSTKAYADEHPYMGAIVGRVANRIGGAGFSIDGTRHDVIANEGAHTVHAGPDGFDTVVWDAEREGEELVFRHTSPAGHQGYPGNLDVTIRTTLTDNELRVKLIAITDAPTPVNLSQHGYWNPAGTFGAPIDTLTFQTPADRYTEVAEDLIPTGQNPSVEGTPYDFRQARPIGTEAMDINLLAPGEGLREIATLSNEVRSVTILSDYPGLQVFTGEALESVDGVVSRGALAIEPQYPPDAVNQPVDSEDTVLRPGEVYRHTIIYRFDGPGFAEDAE